MACFLYPPERSYFIVLQSDDEEEMNEQAGIKFMLCKLTLKLSTRHDHGKLEHNFIFGHPWLHAIMINNQSHSHASPSLAARVTLKKVYDCIAGLQCHNICMTLYNAY